LGSSILLGGQASDEAAPSRPAFAETERGLDPDQVRKHLDALLRWGQRQALRADSAEHTLAAAVEQLNAAAAANRDATPRSDRGAGSMARGARWLRAWGLPAAGWWMLDSVPVGPGACWIEHLVGGPAGLFAVTLQHHRAREVRIDREQVVVYGHETVNTSPLVTQADRAGRLLRAALTERQAVDDTPGGLPNLTVQPILVIVEARPLCAFLGGEPPRSLMTAGGVIVTTPAMFAFAVGESPEQLAGAQVDALFDLARNPSTWSREQ
jgi:hypothetical protein